MVKVKDSSEKKEEQAEASKTANPVSLSDVSPRHVPRGWIRFFLYVSRWAQEHGEQGLPTLSRPVHIQVSFTSVVKSWAEGKAVALRCTPGLWLWVLHSQCCIWIYQTFPGQIVRWHVIIFLQFYYVLPFLIFSTPYDNLTREPGDKIWNTILSLLTITYICILQDVHSETHKVNLLTFKSK